MSPPPHLLSLATAVPAYRLAQQDVTAIARRIFDSPNSEIDYLLPVFENAGIAQRYSCVPLDWYLELSDWENRNALYLENALDLVEQVASDCLDQAGLVPEQVDSILCVSTTGLATPSLEARLMDRLPFHVNVERLPIFGLGCAGGTLGLGRAAAMAMAKPGSRVLLLVVELCGLTFRPADQSRGNIIATALFGDGAAAALLSTDGDDGASALLHWGEHRWPDSQDVMGWRVEADGFGVLFSKDIPSLIRADYAAALDQFLERAGTGRRDLAGYVCHPGGEKVVAALEAVLGLEAGAMVHARDVLRDYGNMSAASVMFVLQRALADRPRGRLLVSSMGPGFTAAFAILDAP